ncbi:MAG: DUF5777 family beta-barrel protein [Saprospiraceae bacterium]
MMKKIIIFNIFFLLSTLSFSQDMLEGIEDKIVNQKVLYGFKSTRVINSHSMEMLPYGNLDFRILHRFDYVSSGVDNFFGLDNARTMRLGFDYGLLDNLTIGIGRSTFKKEIDGFVRYRIIWQSKGEKEMPISLIYTAGFVYASQKKIGFKDPSIQATFTRRMSYYHQLLIGRKFNEKFTLQLAPMLIHTNYVENEFVPNDLIALQLGTRYKITKRMAVLIDYTFPFNAFPYNFANHPLSIGVDIETGGHVFQLHFSNSAGVTERSYINEENGDWLKGEIGFGFNISRLFQIHRKKVEGL